MGRFCVIARAMLTSQLGHNLFNNISTTCQRDRACFLFNDASQQHVNDIPRTPTFVFLFTFFGGGCGVCRSLNNTSNDLSPTPSGFSTTLLKEGTPDVNLF